MGTLARVSQLTQTIGRKGVNQLAAVFPGQRIYVPWSNTEAMQRFMLNFEPLIGADRVARLLDEFGGLRITVPARTVPPRLKGFIPIDMERVIELTEASLTALQISKILKCDPRSVHGARTKARRLGLLKPKRRRKVRK